MGLALAIIIGFVGVVGITHQEALAHKRIEQAQAQNVKAKRKTITHKPIRHRQLTARIDGIEVRNLKG